jgi:tRNA G18 (ribose-2'-O)-methylase SpoU
VTAAEPRRTLAVPRRRRNHAPVPWVPIDDPRDPRIAHFVGLRDRELARRVPPGQPGVFIAEGDIVAERAIRAGYELRAVLVDATRTDPPPRGVGAGVPVYAAAPAVLQRITGLGVHRGLLACFDRRPPAAAAEVLAAARRVVVLERVSNPTNLGVILRSAAGLGMDAALLDPTCSDPLYRRTSRVAMGEGYGFPWAWIPRLPGGLDVLRADGFRLVALTPDDAAVPLDQLASDGADDRLALLFGAEGPGLAPATLAAADVRAGIPMRGGVDSLNVGVAAGIAFWVLGRGGPRRV